MLSFNDYSWPELVVSEQTLLSYWEIWPSGNGWTQCRKFMSRTPKYTSSVLKFLKILCIQFPVYFPFSVWISCHSATSMKPTVYLCHTGFIITHSCWNIVSFPNPILAMHHIFYRILLFVFMYLIATILMQWCHHSFMFEPQAHCSSSLLSLLHIVISFKQGASLRSDLFLKRELRKKIYKN